MIGVSISKRHIIAASIALAIVTFGASSARAQAAPQPSRSLSFGGYATFGNVRFAASESFDAVLGRTSGPIFGGGVRVGLPLGGLFVDVGASRWQDSGERVFVAADQVYKLGIPVDITVTPFEFSAGWRFRFYRAPRFIPYVAGGLTRLNYRESSALATAAEDVDDTFNGYHVFAGAEYKLTEAIGLAGEALWSTVPDAIGDAGVSAAFNETDLGGRAFRLKITIGR